MRRTFAILDSDKDWKILMIYLYLEPHLEVSKFHDGEFSMRAEFEGTVDLYLELRLDFTATNFMAMSFQIPFQFL